MRTAWMLVLAAATAGAQARTVEVRGVAYDSLHGKTLAGAFVAITGTSLSAISDAEGRFTFAAVPVGTHRIVMQHDVLDAIGISAAGTRATVTDGREVVTVAVPSFATLWRTACGPAPPGPDTGFVFGLVTRGGRPVPRAIVMVSWLDLYQDSTKAVRQKQKVLEVDADSAGNYAACGVPTSTGLSARAVIESAGGTWLDILPMDQERIVRRDLTIVALSDAQAPVQTTVLVGRVRTDSTSQPLAGVEISLPELGLATTSDANGGFRLPNVIPGMHLIRARKLGYQVVESRTGFQAGESTNLTLVMSRVTVLDSVSVTADRVHDDAMRTFEEHRKIGLGRFITRAELERQHNRNLGDMVAQFPAINVVRGREGQAWLMGNNRGPKSLSPSCMPPMEDTPSLGNRPCPEACYPRVVVDGVPLTGTMVPNINRYAAQHLEAVEYYGGGAQLPPEYNTLNAHCGVLVLHTRRARPGRK